MNLFEIANAYRHGQNPMTLIGQLAMNDPRAQQAMQIINGKNEQQLQSIAINMAKERGVDINEVARSLGIPLR